jgi:uncharacterized protein (DUF488 family)
MPLAEFIDILRNVDVDHIVDVRKIPGSRRNPQYNIDALPLSLSEYQIGYTHMAALGGRRGRQVSITDNVNGFWINRNFHNYADYAMTSEFRSGFDQLLGLINQRQCAIMCAEVLWWRCHRRIITDYLIASGERVFHILGKDHVDEAKITSGAKSQADGSLTYPGEGSNQ